MEKKETWKKVLEFPKYEVSNMGRIRKKSTKVKGEYKYLKNTVGAKGFLVIGLQGKDKRCVRTVHKIVAKAFISNPRRNNFVNHINGDIKDNSVNNLEWVPNTIYSNKNK
ncbi:MAG: NUMOD4 domain-containing protein [Clostridium sp.]|uniref:NUMOD4 domain-containing protein n=1 Tax=Clostridium sp. TaxID=1506 RepID=UPI003EE52710